MNHPKSMFQLSGVHYKGTHKGTPGGTPTYQEAHPQGATVAFLPDRNSSVRLAEESRTVSFWLRVKLKGLGCKNRSYLHAWLPGYMGTKKVHIGFREQQPALKRIG